MLYGEVACSKAVPQWRLKNTSHSRKHKYLRKIYRKCRLKKKLQQTHTRSQVRHLCIRVLPRGAHLSWVYSWIFPSCQVQLGQCSLYLPAITFIKINTTQESLGSDWMKQTEHENRSKLKLNSPKRVVQPIHSCWALLAVSAAAQRSNRHSEKPGGPQKSWEALQQHEGAQCEDNPINSQGCRASCHLQLSPGPRDWLSSPVYSEAALQCWGNIGAHFALLQLPSTSSLMLRPNA